MQCVGVVAIVFECVPVRASVFVCLCLCVCGSAAACPVAPHFSPPRLSTGDYLFVYNSARAGYPSPKPGYNLQYNPGYVIISGDDPETVLVRSNEPLMTPTLSWEVGNNTAPPRSLTPNVIFVEARFPVAGRHDSFVFYYGAADTDIGAAVVNVTHSSQL